MSQKYNIAILTKNVDVVSDEIMDWIRYFGKYFHDETSVTSEFETRCLWEV